MHSFSPRDVYNLAAEGFDLPALRFWSLFGESLVRAAELRSGEHVLDFGCGTGAASLPAARAVMPDGRVLGIDIAERMIERARARAEAERISNLSFECANLLECKPSRKFDVVLGAFALFFLPDIPGALAHLVGITRAGGRWAFSFWGENSFVPCAALLKEDVNALIPGSATGPEPWERFSTPEKIRGVFAQSGHSAHIVPDRHSLLLQDENDWWTVAFNSGFRRLIELAPPEQREDFRRRHLQRVRGLSSGSGLVLELPVYHALIALP